MTPARRRGCGRVSTKGCAGSGATKVRRSPSPAAPAPGQLETSGEQGGTKARKTTARPASRRRHRPPSRPIDRSKSSGAGRSVGIAGVSTQATFFAKRTSSRSGSGQCRKRSFQGWRGHDPLPALPRETVGGAVGGVGVAHAAGLERLADGAQVREHERRLGPVEAAPGPEQLRAADEVEDGEGQHRDPRPAGGAAGRGRPGHERGHGQVERGQEADRVRRRAHREGEGEEGEAGGQEQQDGGLARGAPRARPGSAGCRRAGPGARRPSRGSGARSPRGPPPPGRGCRERRRAARAGAAGRGRGARASTPPGRPPARSAWPGRRSRPAATGACWRPGAARRPSRRIALRPRALTKTQSPAAATALADMRWVHSARPASSPSRKSVARGPCPPSRPLPRPRREQEHEAAEQQASSRRTAAAAPRAGGGRAGGRRRARPRAGPPRGAAGARGRRPRARAGARAGSREGAAPRCSSPRSRRRGGRPTSRAASRRAGPTSSCRPPGAVP